MKSITVALSNHFNQNLTTVASCWKVTRRDGEVLGFTDHDVTTNIEGVRYIASSGYFRSAITNSATVSVDNLEVQGFLDDEMISEADLRNGAYDFAEVEIFAFNWMDLTQGICRLRYGFFGEVKIRPSGLFVVELRGLMQLFSQTVGETIGPDCRADLGDVRCKVKLLADRRASGKTYMQGDRVIIPDDTGLRAINLPIQNQSFDWYQSTSYYGIWSATGSVVTNYPEFPHPEAVYYLRPTAEAGNFTRVVVHAFADANPPDVETEIGISVQARAFEEGWQVGMFIELVQRHGLFGLTITVIDSEEVPYVDVDPSGTWALYSGTVNLKVPDIVNGARITYRFRRNPASAYNHLAGKVAKVNLAKFAFYGYDDPYMELAMAETATIGNPAGWSGNHISTHAGNVNLMPVRGHRMLIRSIWTTSSALQKVSLVTAGASTIEIDAGNYILDLKTFVGAFEWGYQNEVKLTFRNAANSVIATRSTGRQDIKPHGIIFERQFETRVPPLSRTVDIELLAHSAPERSTDGTQPQVAYDYIEGYLYHVDSDTAALTIYGGVEYQAQNDGVADVNQPVVAHTIGEEVVDGSVTWKAVQPSLTFLGKVGQVFSNTEFTLPTIDAPDNWFTWGVLTFLDGANRRRGVECLSWNNTTKRMIIMLPARAVIEPGTTIRVHAGCDKSREIGGCLKFSNILNYRGEPEVPGTDQYFRVGGTGG